MLALIKRILVAARVYGGVAFGGAVTNVLVPQVYEQTKDFPGDKSLNIWFDIPECSAFIRDLQTMFGRTLAYTGVTKGTTPHVTSSSIIHQFQLFTEDGSFHLNMVFSKVPPKTDLNVNGLLATVVDDTIIFSIVPHMIRKADAAFTDNVANFLISSGLNRTAVINPEFFEQLLKDETYAYLDHLTKYIQQGWQLRTPAGLIINFYFAYAAVQHPAKCKELCMTYLRTPPQIADLIKIDPKPTSDQIPTPALPLPETTPTQAPPTSNPSSIAPSFSPSSSPIPSEDVLITAYQTVVSELNKHPPASRKIILALLRDKYGASL